MMKTEKISRLNTGIRYCVYIHISSVLLGKEVPWFRSYSKANRLMEAVRPRSQNSFTPKPALSTTGLQLFSIWMIIWKPERQVILSMSLPISFKWNGVYTYDQNCLLIQCSGSDGKESACNLGSIPGSGRSSGEGKGNPLQYSCLENCTDRGAWQSIINLGPWVTRVCQAPPC